MCFEDDPSPHDHSSKSIASYNSSLSNQWLALRRDLGAKVSLVNDWLGKYQALLSLLTRSCRIDELERSIMKLKELEETVARVYD